MSMKTSRQISARWILIGLMLLAGLVVVGTANAGEGEWSTPSLVGYEARSIAFAPDNGDLIYLGTNKGLLRSADGGATWGRLVLAGSVTSVAVNLQEPSILFAVMNENLFHSINQGYTWGLAGEGIIQDPVSVAIHPSQPTSAFVMGYGEVYRTTDGGGSWTATGVPSTEWPLTFGFSPSDADRFYAAFGDGIFRSTDGGDSWALITSDLTEQYGPVLNMAVDSTGRVFCWFGGRILRSDDGGESWQSLGGEEDRLPRRQARLRLDSHDESVVYLNEQMHIWRSDDGGSSWQVFENALPGAPSVVAPDPHHEQALVAVISGQLYRSTDRAETWAPVTDAADPQFVFAHPERPDYLLGISNRNRGLLWRSEDGGFSWVVSNTGLEERRVSAIAFDLHDENVVYAGSDGGLYRSENAGRNWVTVGLPADVSVSTVAVSPESSEHLYVGSHDGLVRSLNGGESWTAAPINEEIRQIVVHPANPSLVYALGRGLYVSRNGGETWAAIETGYRDHQSLAVKPDNAEIAYLIADNALYITRDGAVTWQPVAGLPEIDYFVDTFLVRSVPALPELLLVAIDAVIFLSPDAGSSWIPLWRGAPASPIRSLSPGSSQPLVLCATFEDAGAAWHLSLATIPRPPTPTPSPSNTPQPTSTSRPTNTPTPRPTPVFHENMSTLDAAGMTIPTTPEVALAVEQSAGGNVAQDEQAPYLTGDSSGVGAGAEVNPIGEDDESAAARVAPLVRPTASWITYLGLTLIAVAVVGGLALWRLTRSSNDPALCDRCGAVLASEAKFCIKCGTPTGHT